MPEWSKGVHSSCIVFALVGSSPTDDIYYTSGLVAKFLVANAEPRVRFPAGAYFKKRGSRNFTRRSGGLNTNEVLVVFGILIRGGR